MKGVYISVCVCVYQEDEVRSLVVEGDGRAAERGGCVVGALRGRAAESLTGQFAVVQLLLKVCAETQSGKELSPYLQQQVCRQERRVHRHAHNPDSHVTCPICMAESRDPV